MAWRIEFAPSAKKELDKLGRAPAIRVLKFLSERIQTLEDPRQLGSPLHGPELGEFWRYRVGDYRIIASIEDDVFRVLVLHVGHRSDVYRL